MSSERLRRESGLRASCGFVLALSLTMAVDCSEAQDADETRTDSTMVVVQDLSWAHDGTAVYFSGMRVARDYSDYTPEKWAIYRYELGDRAVRRVVAAAFTVAASPTEPRLIAGVLQAGNRDLHLFDTRWRSIARLTTHTSEDFAASWSPDGRRIAFTSKRGGTSQVYVANSDGSDVRQLTRDSIHRTLNPTWSPDGRRIAYFREAGDGRDQIHVTLADGSGDVDVTKDEFNNVFPGWTPAGEVVYGQGRKSEPTRTFVVAVDGSRKRPLLGIQSSFTRYSPDGSRIAYLEDDAASGGTRVILATRDGTVIARVALDQVGDR